MPRHRRTLAIAALLAIGAPALAQGALSEQDARAISDRIEADIAVVDAFGEGQRTALALTPTFGVTTTTNSSININESSMIDGTPYTNNDFPPFTALVESIVQGKNPDGTFKLVSTFTNTGIDDTYPTANEGIKVTTRGWLDTLEGTQAFRDLHESGLPSDNDDVRTKPNADASLAQRLVQVVHAPVVVFPEAPVAPGAVWHVEQHKKEEGVTYTVVTRYTLTSVEGHLATVDVDARKLVDPQLLPKNPQNPDAEIRIEQATNHILGSVTVDLRTGAPHAASIRSDASTLVTLHIPGAEGASTETVYDFFFEITIEPAEEDQSKGDAPADD
jgi:hypothetical protein